ncbi:hypothetical protein PESP_a2853 [Pseudoalteromonas espejiana DSM 9414]|uniref:Septum formation inhibitor Maf n=1 Tax=Pseudoalteromonas espejiana TaxID=28107 RepID=A0A510XQK8_9GAMM|nr:6-hydroxymethylpterin diphosphokinase MptE-like protein [Pseudoalteromonas espejiana]ASM50766.1 hypothetical protein PESP_a2853 [Pseudoalteromonas espejiana DSM 9414]GEK53316.1 hypothetical protein PES01_01610 [Pseudoalteromonas espejiana]
MTLPPNFQEQINDIEQKLSEAQAHELREQQFAIEANERFTKNLAAFEHYYPDVFKALQEFQPREDFCIHVTKSGHGNFVPRDKEAPLYGDDPIEQVRKQVSEEIKNPVFTLTEYTKYNPNNTDLRLHIRYMQSLGKLMHEMKVEGEPELLESLPSTFPTALLFGLGLGYQIELLMEHTTFDYMFIVEPDFEVFYASLYCIDWFSIIQKVDENRNCLFLHIGSTEQELINDLNSIVEDVGAYSIVRSFCFQHYKDETLSALMAKFYSDYFRFQFGFGFYNDAITGLAHSFQLLKKNTSFFDAQATKIDSLKKIPVFIVGNGPSLDEAEEFLKNNHKKAIIFACGTALGSLTSMGIKADFHILVERPYRNYQAVLDMASLNVFKELNLLALNTVYPDTVDLYKWAGLALKGNEAATDFINIMLALHGLGSYMTAPFSNPNVANAGLSFALCFGFKDIYLFGVDNGVVETEHHSKYSIYNYEKKTEFRYFPTKVGEHVLPGNFNKTVNSNSIYATSVKQLEDLIEYKPGASIYNVGNGAVIKGANETYVEDLMELHGDLEKEKYINEIKEKFKLLPIKNIKESDVLIDKAIEVGEELLGLAKSDFSTIEEANELIKRQQRYLYSFRGSIYSHIFQIFKGSLLYYHCPMVTVLYKYKSEVDCLGVYAQVNELWKAYLSEIIEHLKTEPMAKCDWAFYDHMRK